MKLTLLGVTGSVGHVLLAEAINAGHEIKVYTRRADGVPTASNVTIAVGALKETEKLAAAMKGSDAVISALGARTVESVPEFAEGIQSLIRAMNQAEVKRLVAISGAATPHPDDKHSFGSRMIFALVRKLFAGMVGGNNASYPLYVASTLDWTTVRAPGLNNKPASGKVKTGLHTTPGSGISRADLAQFMMKIAASNEFLRQSPFVAS